MSQTSKCWYAIRVLNQHEDMVAKHLHARGLECFAPVYKARHRWSDRTKEIDVPLFAGYVFCQFSLDNRLAALTVPGVLHIVGTGKTPCPIDQSEMTALQVAVKSGLPTLPAPFLEIGHRVRIERGPLGGVEGILLEVRSQHSLVISITLLQRSVAVEVSHSWVRPLPGRPFAKEPDDLTGHVTSQRFLGTRSLSPTSC